MPPPSLTLEPREILQNLHSKDFVPESWGLLNSGRYSFYYLVTLNSNLMPLNDR